MKELTIEEKAKRYDEAIERARAITNGEDVDVEAGITTCEYIFPELKESEDEEIRKWLVEELYKSVNSSISKGFDIDMGKKALVWLEKQGEQKTDDKVEPKFKVGDWVVQENIGVYKVIEVCESWYEVVDNKDKHYSIGFDKEYMCHLWTIQDAKNGDVLATDSWLYMFKYTNNKALIQFHCKCPINGKTYKWSFLSDDSYLDIYIDANIHPATKEQRDLLFQKMKESGYEWDAEKKELKKIEKKSYWSEEDKVGLADAIWAIEQARTIAKDENDMGNLWYAENWLKSLKERYTWKPTEEQMIELRRVISGCSYDIEPLAEMAEQLKKLREE